MEGQLSQELLDDPRYSVLIDDHPGADHLLVVFGGIANRLPIPVFEFMRSLDAFSISKVFIRDLRQSWYTNGLQGISTNHADTVSYLQELINRLGKRRTIFMGNSAGGFAAILYGILLRVNAIHAFSPQTFIDPLHRLLWWDRRWPHEIGHLNRVNREWFDLKKVLSHHDPTLSRIYLYWDKHHRLDSIHARRVSGPGIHHEAFDAGGHTVIRTLRDNGTLLNILEKAFSDDK